jgi:hypothetical protein
MSASSGNEPGADLEQRIDAIESGYEFLLAYAAQGRDTDRGAGSGRSVREILKGMQAALEGLGGVVTACAERRDADIARHSAAFFRAVDEDAARAEALVSLVLAQADISSQLVDNLNASIHLRALLTDLFVVDEALKPRGA